MFYTLNLGFNIQKFDKTIFFKFVVCNLKTKIKNVILVFIDIKFSNWKNYKLSKQNEKLAEKVSKGSVLEILNIDVEYLRYRGTGKEVSTRFAKKVQKVRICFTIGANQISNAEEKIVFMQLIDPNGEFIKGKENIEINVSDSIFNCTTSSGFNYKNIQMNNCFEWERVQQLESGNYLINLIIEGRVSGQKQFKLK